MAKKKDKSSTGRLVFASIAVAVVGWLIGASFGSPDEPEAPAVPAAAFTAAPAPVPAGSIEGPRPRGWTPPDVRALLGGLKVRDTVAGYRIIATETKERTLFIELDRNRSGFTVSVLHKTVGAPSQPPRETEAYYLFYGRFREYGGPNDAQEVSEVVQELERRIRENEAKVPKPKGL